MKITAKQRSLLFSSIRRLSNRLGQPEEAVEMFLKKDLDLGGFSDLSKEDASVLIEHVKFLLEELK